MALNLVANQRVYISGYVQYCTLSHLIEGDQLDRMNQNRRYPLNPNAQITITNPALIADTSGKLNQSATELRDHRFYTTKKEPNVQHFNGMSQKYPNTKHYALPWVAVADQKSHKAHQIKLGKGQELKRGQKVILCLRVFQGSGNAGVSLDGVVALIASGQNPEEILETYGGNSIQSDLANLGLTIDNPAPIEPNDQPVREIKETELPTGMQVNSTQSAAPAAPAQKPEPASATEEPFDSFADSNDSNAAADQNNEPSPWDEPDDNSNSEPTTEDNWFSSLS